MKTFKFGVIGGGMMGKEFASAAARWLHLTEISARPEIVALADPAPAAREWFASNINGCRTYETYQELLADDEVDAVYCAVPHNLHERVYIDILDAGKHLFGEKPFGIDKAANDAINDCIKQYPELVVRCSSEVPFYPGVQRLIQRLPEMGRIFEVRASFQHSSDLDPNKPINWKRMVDVNGEYGCLGDLGMHVFHVPLRLGWVPTKVFALLSNIMTERPDGKGNVVPCETWDNGTLACETAQGFPMILDIKRIAPGEINTWTLEVYGISGSARWSSKNPKNFESLTYTPGSEQSWTQTDIGYKPVFPTITSTVASIFEFGMGDAILQMWASYLTELAGGDAPFGCVTPEETAQQHAVLTAALESARTHQAVDVGAVRGR